MTANRSRGLLLAVGFSAVSSTTWAETCEQAAQTGSLDVTLCGPSGQPDVDSGDAFRRAIHALCPLPGSAGCGGEVHVPPGVYKVGGTIDVPAGVRVLGTGSSVMVLTARPCSDATHPPAVLFHLSEAGAVPGIAGLEGLQMAVENIRHVYFGDEQEGLTGGNHGNRGMPVDGQFPCRAPSDIDATAVRVDGGGSGRVRLRRLTVIGFGTALDIVDAYDGLVDHIDTYSNRIGARLEGAQSWTFNNLMLQDAWQMKLVEGAGHRPPTDIHVFGGLVQGSELGGLWIQSCVSCSFDGIHFEQNRSDLVVDGTGIVRHISVAHSGTMGGGSEWVSIVRLVNPAPACPVDDLTLEYVAGQTLDLRSDCPLHLYLHSAAITVRRSRADGSAGEPKVSIFSPGGPEAPPFELRGEGSAAVGAGGGVGALSLTGPKHLLDLIALPAADTSLPRTVDLRFWAPTYGQSVIGALEARLAPGPDGTGSLALHTQRWNGVPNPALVLTGEGRVGIGTRTPQATLEVDGDVRLPSGAAVRAGGLQPTTRVKGGACPPELRTALAQGPSGPLICLFSEGSFQWMSFEQAP